MAIINQGVGEIIVGNSMSDAILERLSGKLDMQYLEDLAKQLGISNELDYIQNL